ncbi:MAG TPA: sulfate transporter CysZ [Gammaproteobacteria bacterium]|nr:sulfate transporter CysZ [Gammaproteobacteria bacterium]
MISNPLTGAYYLLKGFRLITKPSIRKYVMIPLSINIIFFTALIWWGMSALFLFFDEQLLALPSWLSWLEWLLWPVLTLATLLLVFYSFSVVGNIIASPFNSLLAEAVEHHLTGEKSPEMSWKETVKTILPSVMNEFRKLFYFICWAVPFLLLFFIPVIQVIAPFLWLAFGAWMLMLQYGDYPMANHNISVSEQRKKLAANRMTSLSFGGATMLMTLIPFLNFLVIPSAVAGATVLWVERIKNQE